MAWPARPPQLRLSYSALILLATAGRLYAADGIDLDRHYAVLLDDRLIGSMRWTVTESDQRPPHDRAIVTTTRMRIAVRRGPSAVALSTYSEFAETVDGRPIQARSRQNLGQIQTDHTLRFGRDTITVMRRQGDQVQCRTLPYRPHQPRSTPGHSKADWLTPGQIPRFIETRLAAASPEIRYWSVDPLLSVEPFETQMRFGHWQSIDLGHRRVWAINSDTTVSSQPRISTRQYWDQQGHMVKSAVTVLPGLTVTIVQTDKQPVTDRDDTPDILARTLVRPDQPILQPRQRRSAVYELSWPAPAVDAQQATGATALPQVGFQRVDAVSEHAWRLSIDLDHPVDSHNDPPTDQHLDATPQVNSHDPLIRQLTMRALHLAGQRKTASQQAETLRQFVHRHIAIKNLTVAFATASEVARTRVGDCTEHALLLAAMLRAAGVPSRVASGLIYSERWLGSTHVFGYHMWTQAWIDSASTPSGRWVDLDATLPNASFDAGHITLATSTHGNTTGINDLTFLGAMISRLEIKVMDSDHRAEACFVARNNQHSLRRPITVTTTDPHTTTTAQPP